MPPGKKLVLYGFSALFMSIPISKAMAVVKAKLEYDLNLPDRCLLDVPQLSTLPEMCFPTTYFTYKKEFYKEKKEEWITLSHGRCCYTTKTKTPS